MSKKYIITGTLVALVLVTWFAFGSESSERPNIFVSPEVGEFNVTVTTTGELRAKNSTQIKGPEGMRDIRVYSVNIQKLIPEGTVVQKGDFVAELDRSEVMSKFQDAQLELQKVESQFEQAQLDSTLTLSQARDNLINLEYTVEEREIAVEQSKYESPAVKRQAQIDFEKAQRQLEQEKKNYVTKTKQAEAKLREIEADLEKEKRELQKIQDLLGKFRISAPENGMVIYKRNRNGSKLTEGGSVSAWDPVVAELPDFSIMESVTYVNEVDIQNVKTNQLVDIGLDADPEKRLTGVVTNVANIGEQRPNSDSKVFQVIIRVNEADTTLRPAMTTSNLIHVNSFSDVLHVPLETVHTQDSLNFVFKSNGMNAVMQQVVMGAMNENNVVIHKGLTVDDQLYLSTPQDTSGISIQYLPEEIVQKYREQEEVKKQEMEMKQEPADSTSASMDPRRMRRMQQRSQN